MEGTGKLEIGKLMEVPGDLEGHTLYFDQHDLLTLWSM